MRVMVTGSAGSLGGHIVERLKQDPEVEQIFSADNIEPTCGGRHINGTHPLDVSDFSAANEYVKRARKKVPSLIAKRVSPHTLGGSICATCVLAFNSLLRILCRV